MSDVVIRIAETSDAATLSDLGRRTFVETFGHLYAEEDIATFLRDKHSIAAYEATLSGRQARAWIAEDKGDAVAYACAGPCGLPLPQPSVNAGELWRLYVLGPYQGAGLAPRLMSAAMQFLEERFDDLYLSVYAYNERAQRFYRRFGFQKFHEYSYMVGRHADPEWIMRRVEREARGDGSQGRMINGDT